MTKTVNVQGLTLVYRRFTLWLLLGWSAVAGCGCDQRHESSETETTTVLVLAASSTANAVEEVCRAFEVLNPSVRVRVAAGGSNALASQITSGVPADLFLSASNEWLEYVENAGHVDQSIPLLENRLVIAAPRTRSKSLINGPSHLSSASVERIALAGEHVPAGRYAEQALRHHGMWTTLAESGRIVRASNVRMTLAYIERGEVDAGLIYATDAAISGDVEVVYEFARSNTDPIEYPLALLKRHTDREVVQQLFAFFQTAEAVDIFKRYGFGVATR